MGRREEILKRLVAQRAPGPAQTDALLARLAQIRSSPPRPMLEASRSLAATKQDGWRRAEEFVKYPGDLARVDEFLGDHGMLLGDPLGAGVEAVVWEAIPRSGSETHVLKVRPYDKVETFDLPEGVPGVAPYWAKQQVSPHMAVALQPRAAAVYRQGSGLEDTFKGAGGRVWDSLAARGWRWDDGHRGNLGVMTDGTWSVFDGFMRRADPEPGISAEEAIRMLRMTPDERAAIYGGR